ncbi:MULTISPECIES: hypothetical protein [unclassified Bacillus cereus group]|uniref:hypothetical protein n=1 Tax=unclassified Bacillus cereus group TaxID=2750818 RepID=UPI0029C18540|nr:MULTISPECIES: hypothetical protein [unclassified Bacillus cereus group]MDX5880829.1 hypothetical protein [Bacillus cereus group sp. BfR-BA-01042]MDX5906677.1 hypothetical protein [Bacillus cereus group sp. BfR-BA-01048]
MGIGKKITNEVIDISASLLKRGLNDAYSIGKILVKESFKTSFKFAKNTAKFSYHVVKILSKKAMDHHNQKQLTRQESYSVKPLNKLQNKQVSFEQFQQPPQQQVQKQNNVVYTNEFQQRTGQKMFTERHVHEHGIGKVEEFHRNLLDSGYLDHSKEKDVKKVIGLLQEERKMLSKNKVFKNSEYYAMYDYVNNATKGKQRGVKQAVQKGDVKEFTEEYKQKYEIVRADISSYYQKIEKTKDPQEKMFWAGRLENYAVYHDKTLKQNGLGKSIEGMKVQKTSLTPTEKLEAKLKKLESLKKGMNLHNKIEKKVATMENSRLKFAMENRNGPSFEDMFLKTDKERQQFRESQKRIAAEEKAHREREIYF